MTPQEMRLGLLTIAGGMRHSGFASSREIAKRLAGLVGSGENALRVVAEAERIGLIAPEPYPEDPASPDRMWRLVGRLDAGGPGNGAPAPQGLAGP